MKKILEFLSGDGDFLYQEHNCRIVNSEYIATFGGTGSVTLCDGVIELKLWLDRDRLFLDLRTAESDKPWIPMGILKELLTGEEMASGLIDKENVDFLKGSFLKLQDCLSYSKVEATEATCELLRKKRSKAMWGEIEN